MTQTYYDGLHVELCFYRLRSPAGRLPARFRISLRPRKSFFSALQRSPLATWGRGRRIAIVHLQEPATQLFFGEARKGAGQPVDGETSYNWASITKTMTAIAILQLRDRGKLSLDDPAVRYVPELQQVHDDFGPIDAITIRELLTIVRFPQSYMAMGLRRCVKLRLAAV